jgi:peptidoglycan/LPS O-acetylase OafA/YrhL
MLAPDDLQQVTTRSAPLLPWASAFTDYCRRERFGSLDGLRCLCIMAVLWHHGSVWGTMATQAPLLTRGFLGVDFFFVLSGFLITTLLLREAARNGQFSLSAFYRRRFLRIVPVYFFLVTAISVYFVWVKGQEQYAGLVPYYYLFLANFLSSDIPMLAPTWSLSVEEQYYLVWPLLLMLLPQRAVLPVLAVLIAINVAGVMGAFAGLGIHAFDIGPLHIALPNATYAPILMGSVLAMMLQNARGFSALFFLFGRRGTPLILMLLLIGLVAILPSDLRGLPNLAIHLAMTACLASLVLREDHLLAPILGWRPIARVGVISYGIYLYHLVGLHVSTVILSHLGLNTPWLSLVFYSAIAILIAEISYRTLEAWFRRLNKASLFSAGSTQVR